MEPGSINKDVLALVHDPGDIGLGVAVEFNDSSVLSLHTFLSVEAVFDVVNVSTKLLNVSFVCAGFPVVLANLFSVISDLLGIVFDFFLCPLNSLDELGKNDSGGFNCNNLVRVDIYLMGIALVVNCWFVDIPIVDGISKALWSDRSSVSIVVVWSILDLFDVWVGGCVDCGGNSDKGSSSEGCFHEVIKV